MEWSKAQEVNLINNIQNECIQRIINLYRQDTATEAIHITSATGTGKTKMIGKLLNTDWGRKYFFLITTLSRGGLNKQIEKSLKEDCLYNNFIVHGTSEMTATTIFQPQDLFNELKEKAQGKPIIWIRDEAHIASNIWDNALRGKYNRILNFSATNSITDIDCDFSLTCMLRTPHLEKTSDVGSALDKLLEIKEKHKTISNYNPCALFRCINNPTLRDLIYIESKKRNLKVIDLNEDNITQVQELCEDNNEYDVIIQKMKIVEGVDIRRAHIVYLGNIPSNPDTIIQFIGRARRNALLWRQDFDIFDTQFSTLFEETRKCYVYFNVEENTENYKEVEELLENKIRNMYSIHEFREGAELIVENGVLPNGMTVFQLENQTGTFYVQIDPTTGLKYAHPAGEFYQTREVTCFAPPQKGYIIQQQEMYGLKDISYYDEETNTYLPIGDYVPYKKTINDFESALLGGENFKYYKETKTWNEMRSVSTRIGSCSSLLSRFLAEKYKDEIENAYTFIEENKLSGMENSFPFDKTCNKCLGWLVEFYTKYLVFGRQFLLSEIKEAQSEANTDEENIYILFYACFLKYKKMMIQAFGNGIARFIVGPSIQDYIKKDYQVFVNTVVELAHKTKTFLIDELKLVFKKNNKLFDENLSIEHIAGKADFVTEDTIVDLKTTSKINKQYVRQVLAYHYLSTKRSDLKIKQVIIFDCVLGNYVRILITPKNLVENEVVDLPYYDLPRITKQELEYKQQQTFLQPLFIKSLDQPQQHFFIIKEPSSFKTSNQKELFNLLFSYQQEFQQAFIIGKGRSPVHEYPPSPDFYSIYKDLASVRNCINKWVNEGSCLKWNVKCWDVYYQEEDDDILIVRALLFGKIRLIDFNERQFLLSKNPILNSFLEKNPIPFDAEQNRSFTRNLLEFLKANDPQFLLKFNFIKRYGRFYAFGDLLEKKPIFLQHYKNLIQKEELQEQLQKQKNTVKKEIQFLSQECQRLQKQISKLPIIIFFNKKLKKEKQDLQKELQIKTQEKTLKQNSLDKIKQDLRINQSSINLINCFLKKTN